MTLLKNEYMNIIYLNCGKYELDRKKIIAIIDIIFAVVKRNLDGLLVQFVERYTGIAEVIGFESRTGLILQLQSCVYNCDDLLSI